MGQTEDVLVALPGLGPDDGAPRLPAETPRRRGVRLSERDQALLRWVGEQDSVRADLLGVLATHGVGPEIEQFVVDNAPRSLAGHQLNFLERCAELGLTAELPATSTPRTYLNLFPPKRYGAKRAGVLETRTGRADLYCSPEHVEGRRFAEEITNNDVAFAVKVYLKSPEAVDEAIDLARLVLEER